MKLLVLKIGRPKGSAYQDLVNDFSRRCQAFGPIEHKLVPARGGIERSTKAVVEILENQKSSVIIGLDERGAPFTSVDLAKRISSWRENPSVKMLTFVVGGPYGLTDAVRSKFCFTWSLASGVYPSDLAWVMVWEQLYRANSILAKTPYHHE